MVDLDELARLDAAASAGPWHIRFLDDDHCAGAVGISNEPDDGSEDMATLNSSGPNLLAATLVQHPPYVVAEDRLWHENAELIVAVRNALPDLIRLARLGAARES